MVKNKHKNPASKQVTDSPTPSKVKYSELANININIIVAVPNRNPAATLQNAMFLTSSAVLILAHKLPFKAGITNIHHMGWCPNWMHHNWNNSFIYSIIYCSTHFTYFLLLHIYT